MPPRTVGALLTYKPKGYIMVVSNPRKFMRLCSVASAQWCAAAMAAQVYTIWPKQGTRKAPAVYVPYAASVAAQV